MAAFAKPLLLFFEYPSDWYIFALSCVATIMVLTRLGQGLCQRYWPRLILLLAQRWSIPSFMSDGQGSCSISVAQLLLWLAFVSTNVLLMLYRAADRNDIGHRSGILATANLAPLLVGTRLSLIADLEGVSLQTQFVIHRMFTLMALSTGVVHVTLGALEKSPTWNVQGLCAVTCIASMAAVTVLSVGYVRQHFYEVFLRIHVELIVLALSVLWQHLATQRRQARVYVLASIGLWVSLTVAGFVYRCYRNISNDRRTCLSKVTFRNIYQSRLKDQVVIMGACHAEIWIGRLFKVRPGQYLYLTVPAFGFPSNFQWHPFWIVWWEPDLERGGIRLEILVRQRHGFTRGVSSYCDREYTACIKGPFGRSRSFRHFGTILMFATDVGIAVHLPYLKDLLEDYARSSVCTRRVMLVWQVEHSNHDKWAKKWIDELLPQDTSYILEIRVHCPGNTQYQSTRGTENHTIFLAPGDELLAGRHGLVSMIASPADFQQIFVNEVAKKNYGRLLVSACVDAGSRQLLRAAVARVQNPDVQFFDHDVEPPRVTRSLILD